MILKKIFTGILALAAANVLLAQASTKDTVVNIQQIEVTTSRLKNFALGTTIQKIDPEILKKDNTLLLTDIFASQTGLAIKTYGLGGLATISVRGAGSAHTAVLWNGLNIQSPMSGAADLSTIPAFLVSDITIQEGGSGTLFGSGAVGGIIHISTFENMNEKNNVAFQAGIGSFNRKDIVFSAKTGTNDYAFTLKIFRQSAGNDFPFINTWKEGNPRERQTNAGSLGYGFMPDLQIKTSKKSSLNLSALYQKYSKDVQTMMTLSVPGKDNQSDDNIILTANWRYLNPKYTLNIKSGFVKNRILMLDKNLPEPQDDPVSTNIASSFINEAESKIYIKPNHTLNAGVNYTFEKGESEGYSKDATRGRVALFSTYKITDLVEKVDAAFSLREEFEKDKIHPLIYSFGADYNLDNATTIKGNISRNYRIPAFNDLYWKFDGYTQGNPGLKPEQGYSGELGLYEKLTPGDVALDLSQTVFASSMKNWIAWLPDNSYIWKPENKEREKSMGVELRAKGEYTAGKSRFVLNGFYDWTKAELTTNDVYDDQQMIYVPEHRVMASLDYYYKRFSANFNFNYVGKRYYYSYNSLKAYNLGNFALYYDLPVKDNILKAAFRLYNIWNTKYQSIAYYSMPLRNYQLSLYLRINTKY
jgi:vitamin B12 transporter